MIEDSDRFAFISRRIHAFASIGNAYDASQCDGAIETGHTLIVLSEGVVALAGTWPIAVTAAGGMLHSVPSTTLKATEILLAEAGAFLDLLLGQTSVPTQAREIPANQIAHVHAR